jgi:hypothetical protein
MTYLIENNCRALLAATHAYQSPLDRVVIIHHEEKMELGHVELTWAGHVPYVMGWDLGLFCDFLSFGVRFRFMFI